MKFIKNRDKFLKEEREAKIRDVLHPKQAQEVIRTWGEKYLDYEEIIPTDNIKQGKWKLSEEDKNKALGAFFQCDMDIVTKLFSSLPDKFAEILFRSIDPKLITTEKHKIILENLNIQKPTIDQIFTIYNNVFRKLNVGETTATEVIQKDKNGRPVVGEDGKMIKTAKKAGEPVFSNNLVNINTFTEDYNKCYSEFPITKNLFQNNQIANIRNMANQCEVNPEYKIDFGIFGKDLYLDISYDPKHILNMSISKFYTSCQHLYTGAYKQQVLANIFDPNSLPAFLLFETDIFWGKEKISNFIPLSRMMIRNIETFDAPLAATKTAEVSIAGIKAKKKAKSEEIKPKIFYDRAYPDRMKPIFGEIVRKYSENIENYKDKNTYYFTPDINIEDKITQPYMDMLRDVQIRPYIGVNTKTLYLNRMVDWSKIKISPHAKIKELIIETTDIPDDLTKMTLTPDWIKFKYLSINTLKNFDKVKSDAIAFDKCKFNTEILNDINKSNPDIKKLQIVSCDLIGDLNFSEFKSLDELQIIYTLDTIEDLKKIVEGLKVNKLLISGDLIKNKDCKAYINSLKSRGFKIEIVGPVI